MADMVGIHTLKVAFRGVIIAREGGLGYLFLQLLQDLLIRNIALLIILVNHESSLVADSINAFQHQCGASIVTIADVAVYAFPARVAVAGWTISRRTLVARRQRSTERVRTILPSPSCRAYTSTVRCATVGELVALEVLEVAVETRRTAIGPVFVLEVIWGRPGDDAREIRGVFEMLSAA